MTGPAEIFDLLAAHMADAETHWSLGTFGALAEFMRDRDEPVALSRSDASLCAVTARGAIRIAPVADTRPVASESTTRESWNHRIALCLPADRCAMSRRTALTDLGPDADALREEDRTAIVFDLGLGAWHADLCVRVADPAAVAQLRVHAGKPVLEPGNPVMGLILAANPHRVFMSRLGRIEVFQPIPPPNGKSPEGPHTHVLPKLLQHRRTHAATEPIPEGLIPCAHLYPAHPAKDQNGRFQPFDRGRHEAFQAVLAMFGDPELVALKRRVMAGVAAGENPAAVSLAGTRHARTNVRIALRQLKAMDRDLPFLAPWAAAHERFDRPEPDEDADQHG